ncbi:hypothetical protein [Tuwongella immobilis]|uniref:Uncharacterized protein n=1 Tax=Tuwongella immobilis TaxID=692036 RepID=A0A6C2YHN2_9BACT|nr:hypothetical protein [Tuwongella immobilis]VIP00761.1 Uncharacterized protein OS=Planctomyces brasiliensis (strain ATCC 49424 / DSM 5305 / JCM 21570 / NBRC 103401 / IFAM 1448) GN=Plabr_4641 PE=4 SV=1 [Tuwongella immobilis]VTR96940.1 Uncharacterized protein OS=Planctomyces brasiliensis (strain ATCC 49424 / DSM 5305 / JCM 21570 / NBRC 103401 / IFAM 1448) GN=Plabr_4641 PE=4 SV=1 [Tuwongella immobilis]
MIDKDGFEAWVMFVDDTIAQLLSELPEDTSQQLNFTPESLDVLEGWLLSKYDSPHAILQPSENWYIDRASKYVGETIRRNAGGEWAINLDDPSYAYYGVPEIRSERFSTECPASLVTASLDRRRGNFIRTIVENIIRESR